MLPWLRHTNIYEVNLRQYTPEGTINAFAAHLPRLQHMGVETLWFMPITPISQKNKKGSLGSYYACADYTAVAEEFGTLEDFKTLVTTAHGMGFKVILDWVANHTGWDHRWTVEHPDWYERDKQTGDFKKASGMDDIIEMDFGNGDMRRAMIEAMQFWVRETDIDGFRCDLAFWVELHFWQEARSQVDAIKPLFWLGELDVLEHNAYMQVFDAGYTWQWMHQTESFYKGALPIAELLKTIDAFHRAQGIKVWFTANHDENSWNGTEYEKYGHLAQTLAVFSCTWPGIPLLYSGQELPNHKRLEFFEKDAIDWRPINDLHTFYRELLLLKKSNAALGTDAAVELLLANEEQRLLVFRRSHGADAVIVALNFSGEDRQFYLAHPADGYTDLFTKAAASFNDIRLTAWGHSVWVSTAR